MPARGILAGVSASNKRFVRIRRAGRHKLPGFGGPGHEEEKVPAVGEELREEVTPLLRQIDASRQLVRRPRRRCGESVRRDCRQRGSCRPGSTCRRWRRNLGRQRLHRAAVDVDAFQADIGKEADGSAIGRPERPRRPLGSRPTAWPSMNQATAARTGLLADLPTKTMSAVRRNRHRGIARGRRGELETRF